ncbi:hypothetical protein HNY73_005272 [Argiope bruennichi]|uniref:Uncharacterized protein n=1 Tax=Argiope bruennichi TaxID=94029 RepID=A0A8T0FFZ4_ARGBR|nr:hypothetical protein HNY73_005272 [Argiope bruennichi]
MDVFSNWAKEYKMSVCMPIIRNDSVTSSSFTQTTCKASRDRNTNNEKLRKRCKTSYKVSPGVLQIQLVRLGSPLRGAIYNDLYVCTCKKDRPPLRRCNHRKCIISIDDSTGDPSPLENSSKVQFLCLPQ